MAKNRKSNKKRQSGVVINKPKFSRRTFIAVTVLVAAVGAYHVFRTYAADPLSFDTKKIVGAGSVSTNNSVSSMARSPISLDACRMSDTPGEGAANRVYVGAKPVISKFVADKLNAVWDKYYPEYHIDGQDVTYAADYQMPEQVFYDAYYIIDRDKPTDTKEQYKDFLLPSEGYPQYFSGKFWVPFGVAGQPDWFESKYFNYPGKAVKKFWDNATLNKREAKYVETGYNGEGIKGVKSVPSAGGSSSSANNKSKNQSAPNNNNSRQSNPSDVSKLNMILGTVTSTTNPNLGLYPGTLPGRTSWSYLEGPVVRYRNPNNPNSYSVVNNPNPFIKFHVRWLGGRTVGSVGENSKKIVDHNVKVIRFKDLPKCGNTPLQSQNQIDSKADFSKVIYGNYERAFNQIKAEGINVGVAGKGQDRIAEIFINNGISPLASLGSPYWTSLPPVGGGTGLPGYGNYGTAAYPEPY